MKPVLIFLLASSILFASCNTSKNPIFGKATPHEKYKNAIKNAGLTETTMVQEWLKAAHNSLNQPLKMTVPFEETGYFAAEEPSAAGYLFDVKRGEKIYVSIDAQKDSSARLFAEVYKINETGHQLIEAFENLSDTLRETVKKDCMFLIRVQPELLVSLQYTIRVTSGPSLAFPVDSSGKPRFISYWGAGRDEGKRKHEGVDIQAKFRTPALAAANGYVFRVGDNRLGGKIVFLRDNETGNSLYYAHLDSQIATAGQRVTIGDTLGLVGKTGNAINTVPHLHFGIYTSGGAIDPLVFVDPVIKTPAAVKASLDYLNEWIRVLSTAPVYASANTKAEKLATLQKGEVARAIAATANWYKVITAEGLTGYIKSSEVSNKPIRTETIDSEVVVLNKPTITSTPKAQIPAKTSITVLGKHGGYQLIKYANITGWILKP